MRASTKTTNVGDVQEEALPNIYGVTGNDKGNYRCLIDGVNQVKFHGSGTGLGSLGSAGGTFHGHSYISTQSQRDDDGSCILLDASCSNPAYGRDDKKKFIDDPVNYSSTTEVRPKSLVVTWIIRVKQGNAEDQGTTVKYVNKWIAVPGNWKPNSDEGGAEFDKEYSFTIYDSFVRGNTYYISAKPNWLNIPPNGNRGFIDMRVVRINGKPLDVIIVKTEADHSGGEMNCFSVKHHVHEWIPESTVTSVTIVVKFTRWSMDTDRVRACLNIQSGSIA